MIAVCLEDVMIIVFFSLSNLYSRTSKDLSVGVLLMVISPCFYITKTVNKTLFLGANKQEHSDLGRNNLVPHVHVIICL